MSRRLLDTKAGHALWEYDDHNGVHTYKVWEPIVTPKTNLGDVSPLASDQGPISSFAGGLYGQGESRAERQSRAIDERLRALGLPTPRRRVR